MMRVIENIPYLVHGSYRAKGGFLHSEMPYTIHLKDYIIHAFLSTENARVFLPNG